jgi:hypothetical protein
LEAGRILEAAVSSGYPNLPIQGDVEYPPLGTPMPEPMRMATALFLENESDAFDLIDDGAQYEAARYPVQFTTPPGANPFPHLGTVRHAVRGQLLRTLYVSGRGEPDALVAEFDKLVSVAGSLREEPILISQMVAIATTRLALDAAERVLNENELTAEHLRQLDAALARLDDEDGLVRAFVGERCYSSSLMARQLGVPIVGAFFRADYLGGMDEFIEIAEDGLPERLDDYRAKFGVSGPSYARPLSAVMAPNLLRSMQSHYEGRSLLQAARAAVAIEIWRSEGGELPDDVSGFPADIRENWPVDPFSGDPFIFKRLDQGFIVYSVGGDFEDDGGVPEDAEPDAHRENHLEDVIFRILK